MNPVSKYAEFKYEANKATILALQAILAERARAIEEASRAIVASVK